MKALTQNIIDRLLANGRRQAPVRGTDEEIDFFPVVKLFTPDAQCTWLLTEIDPEEPDLAFGLCDLGLGFPELGPVSLAELDSVRGHLGLRIERDQAFTARGRLSTYAHHARAAGQIVDLPDDSPDEVDGAPLQEAS